ncbi:type II toxin-antitoxin system RelE/ParE family toxin [Pseudolabrys taiwanensis]|uniref:Type II toxin-antitoxin system RelE/ParE family toxin n=1 Tax=Pseudolabrys taiwanensis TaxID=331696 RepID=A0A345ZW75_9HYPH|nr:type II toxin-antitoxin system RelE/ParE family toxin [Pseudolabrys taiwanensis]AXK81172.1 type II toxin-antitoxin system RelE/ParE family toxin [Pseudolabrys taiwanensis]
MIVSFGDGEAAKIWLGERSRRVPFDIQAVALRKLRLIDAARRVDDLRVPPGNRLEKLGGDRAGQWSIRINDQWRIVFFWSEAGAEHVAIVDYH